MFLSGSVRGNVVAEPVSLTVGAVVATLLTKAAEKSGENLADAAKAAVSRLGLSLRIVSSAATQSRSGWLVVHGR